MNARGLATFFLAGAVVGCGGGSDYGDSESAAPDTQQFGAEAVASLAAGQVYALDFVATAAIGYDLNDAGDVVGMSYSDPGCGPFCLPPQEAVIWKGGNRIVLPLINGATASTQYPYYINNQGLIGGEALISGTARHAAAWIPGSGDFAATWLANGGGYSALSLGTFPGTSSVNVAGLDEQGRMVGWGTLGGAIPSYTAPFMWSRETGMVNLHALGYPNERPAAISPGGKVVTWSTQYQLGDPASVKRLPATPSGFVGTSTNGSAINDAGDQAHFLVSTSSQNLVYPFRVTSDGTWQQLSTAGTGNMSRYRMGSIGPGRDVTFTVLSTGMIANGPNGLGRPLSPLVSPAYAGATVTDSGPMNASGQILAQALIGRSQRVVKMTPVTSCETDCIVSSSLVVNSQFVQDPALPGSCIAGGKMYNQSSVTVTMTSETGAPLGNVQVSGRFLDDYWTNHPVSGTTNASGTVTWSYKGLCGVGAITFLVDKATLGTRSLDRTRGTLAGYAIPSTTQIDQPPKEPVNQTPANQAPVAEPVVTCTTGKRCAFDGSRSYDPDGSIASYRWAANNGTTLATQAVFQTTFSKAGKESVVLHVTDNGGRTGSKKVMFTVLR